MKTLTVMIGNARGGEKTWETCYKHLLAPLNSDLALCFGETNDKSSFLYQKAKYVWEIPEMELPKLILGLRVNYNKPYAFRFV
jgi:hypothetical protein